MQIKIIMEVKKKKHSTVVSRLFYEVRADFSFELDLYFALVTFDNNSYSISEYFKNSCSVSSNHSLNNFFKILLNS